MSEWNYPSRTVVCTSSGTTFRNVDSFVFVDRTAYQPYEDLDRAVFELARLYLNGTNDLDYVLERLQVHQLNPETNL